MKTVLFILNSKAGTKRNINFQEEIKQLLHENTSFDFLVWKSLEQDIYADIKSYINTKKYDIVVSIGGDGTMNLVASALLHTNIPLLILPLGSGNGLARHLNLPLDWRKTVNLIYTGKPLTIDSGLLNNIPFFCTSGIGFDAHIGHLFATSGTRGLTTYAKLTIREFLKYKPQHYIVTVDGKQHKLEAFLITIANANQWGNNVYIAPMASLADGLLQVICINPIKLWQVPNIIFEILFKKIKNNKRFTIYNGKSIQIEREKEGCIHYDGEPDNTGTRIEYTIQPQSLVVLVP